ncbi:MAG: 2-oxoacid:ferredoxin oxidoreductase subunit beta [Anaerolineae bacterium]|nr:2-oxoacid:ferredoxin oxidoreductase subunit beta [Anaerolineae bacterium]
MATRADYKGQERPTWCPGCGDYGILNALTRALVEQNIAPHEAIVVTGIGCGSKLPHYMRINGLHTLHGRPVPVAQGIKLANHDLRVIVVHGDGDGYGEGLGHFAHEVRRNPNITELVQNNKIYGLTKGQYSPTSERGKRRSTTPQGSLEHPVQPLALAITHGANFVARGYPGQLNHLIDLIGQALQWPGYALVDILQPCVSFNRERAYDYYNERIYLLEEDETYDPTDRNLAWQRAQEWGDRIPIGVFYRGERVAGYELLEPALQKGPLVKQPLSRLNEAQIAGLFDELS